MRAGVNAALQAKFALWAIHHTNMHCLLLEHTSASCIHSARIPMRHPQCTTKSPQRDSVRVLDGLEQLQQ